MARTFNGSASSDFQLASAFGLTAVPITLCCWFKRSATSTTGVLICVNNGNAIGTLSQFDLAFGADGNLYAETGQPGSSAGATVSTNTTNWVCGSSIYPATNSRTAYADGVAGSTNTTTISPSGLNQLNIGVVNEITGINYAACSVAAAAGWSSVLDTYEIASLVKGFPPRRIRPQSLSFYIPTIRENVEWRNSQAFVTTGGTVSDHPRAYGM